MGRPVNNAVLAEKIDAFIQQSQERHGDNVSRMDEIRADVKEAVREAKLTNGRLQRAEVKIDIHSWALGLLGSGLLVWAGAWLSKVL